GTEELRPVGRQQLFLFQQLGIARGAQRLHTLKTELLRKGRPVLPGKQQPGPLRCDVRKSVCAYDRDLEVGRRHIGSRWQRRGEDNTSIRIASKFAVKRAELVPQRILCLQCLAVWVSN